MVGIARRQEDDMERRKLDLDYIQLFPRTVEHGLAPQHVEQSDFVAECRHEVVE